MTRDKITIVSVNGLVGATAALELFSAAAGTRVVAADFGLGTPRRLGSGRVVDPVVARVHDGIGNLVDERIDLFPGLPADIGTDPLLHALQLGHQFEKECPDGLQQFGKLQVLVVEPEIHVLRHPDVEPATPRVRHAPFFSGIVLVHADHGEIGAVIDGPGDGVPLSHDEPGEFTNLLDRLPFGGRPAPYQRKPLAGLEQDGRAHECGEQAVDALDVQGGVATPPEHLVETVELAFAEGTTAVKAKHGEMIASQASLDARPRCDYNVITMKTRLVRIGNSRGLRLPKPIIEEAGLKDEVEVTLRDGALIITSADHPRAGWDAAVNLLLERGENSVLEPPAPTRFDDEEWEW